MHATRCSFDNALTMTMTLSNLTTVPTTLEIAVHVLEQCVEGAYRRSEANRAIWSMLNEAAQKLGGYDDDGAITADGPDIPRAIELLRLVAPMTLEPVPPVVVRKGKDLEQRQRDAQLSAKFDRERLRLEVHAVLRLLDQGPPAPAHLAVDKLAAAADAADAFARAIRSATGA